MCLSAREAIEHERAQTQTQTRTRTQKEHNQKETQTQTHERTHLGPGGPPGLAAGLQVLLGPITQQADRSESSAL
jgi:hypothetical protein